MSLRWLFLAWLALPFSSVAAQATSDSLDAPLRVAMIEQVPLWPGCESQSGTEAKTCTETALIGHVSQETKYPRRARKKGIEGKVMVEFVVEKDGSISSVRVLRSVHPLLDKEAIRVVNTFPEFSPGLQRGKPVRVVYVLPMNFALK